MSDHVAPRSENSGKGGEVRCLPQRGALLRRTTDPAQPNHGVAVDSEAAEVRRAGEKVPAGVFADVVGDRQASPTAISHGH